MIELKDIKCRNELPRALPPYSIAVELGVRIGVFSETLLKDPNIKLLYSIDAWGNEEDPISEYYATIKRLHPYRARNSILRMKFDQAALLFEDENFDLVYVDGYAAEGEDHGRTFWDWWPKVRRGGIFAGHDYCKESWPLVPMYLDKFAEHHGLEIHVTAEQSDFSTVTFPSWVIRKPC